MKIYLIEEKINNRIIYILLPNNYYENKKHYRVLFWNDLSLMTYLERIQHENIYNYIIVLIKTENSYEEYTPWNYENEEFEFSGKGDEYLNEIENYIIPYINKRYNIVSNEFAMGGYSLGGLFSLYAGLKYKKISKIISISGSFWYPKFKEYIDDINIKKENLNIYLSIGDLEGTKNENVMKDAGKITYYIYNSLIEKLNYKKISLVWNKGEHIGNNELRIIQSLMWLNGYFK